MGHLSLALAHQSLGNAAEATARFEAAAEFARQARWLDAEASATGNLGVMAWRAGDLAEAATLLGQAVDLARAAGAVGVEANSLGNLAILNESRGRLDESATAFLDLIPLFQRTGNRDGEAHATSNLTEVLRMLGRWDEAIRHGNRAVELFQAIGDASRAAPLASIGLAHCALGQFDRAVEAGRTGLDIARRAEQPYLEVDCLEALAEAYAGRGDDATAQQIADEALRIGAALDSPEKLVQAQLAAASVHRAAGRLDQARDSATAVLAIGSEHGFLPAVATALTVLAEIARDVGDAAAATAYGTRSLELSRDLGLAPLTERATRILRP
jgi:tetratricopeptide (TPR) repeat protein